MDIDSTNNRSDYSTGFDLSDIRKILLPKDEINSININVTLSQQTINDLKMISINFLENLPLYLSKTNKKDAS